MALILELLTERGISLVEIMDKLPLYASQSKKVDLNSERALKVVRALTKRYENENISTFDGLRIDWDSSWILIRSSNTEPVVRLYAESMTQADADALVSRFHQEMLEI